MPIRRRLLIALVPLLFLGLEATASSLAPDVQTRVRLLIRKFESNNTVPGSWSLVIALGRDGRLLLNEAYGESAPGQPAEVHTIYHVGSLTKQMTAAAILDLMERGGRIADTTRPVALSSDVATLLDGFEHWSRAQSEPITVRRLLNMTSNLPNFTREVPAEVNPWGTIDHKGLLRALRTVRPYGWPGTFEYSNTSYFLLAEIIDRTVAADPSGGAGYRKALEALFARAGMRRTGFVGDHLDGATRAKPHYDRKPAFIAGDWLRGSGDVASTAGDLFLWNKALMEDRLLKRPMRELMFEDGGRITPTLWYGMGFFVEHKDGRDEFTHTGSVPGYASFNGIYRRTRDQSWASVTLLTNNGGLQGLDALAGDIADVLFSN